MLHKQLITTIATGTLLLNALTPMVFADTTLQVTGNGASSNNTVNTTTTNTSTLVQTNTANVQNNVSSNSNTGNNNADENTGGNVTVDTGNATNLTDVQTRANANVATAGNCTTCGTGNTSVLEAGNGADSQNTTNVTSTNTSSLFQTNDAQVTNDVTSNAQTGDNNANRNTGGDVLVLTGHASNETGVSTAVNGNVAQMGAAGTAGNTADLRIVGNGFNSDNSINATLDNAMTLVQNNLANINNRIDSQAVTGNNNADENTGGNVTVDTGNARNITDVRNLANFNSADMSNCGCTIGDVFGKISGNGADSNSTLNATLADDQSVFQTGSADVNNDVNNNSQTGNNNANRNTGAVLGLLDPVGVTTGFSGSDTTVRNATNENTFGPSLSLPGGLDLSFGFDLGNLFGTFH